MKTPVSVYSEIWSVTPKRPILAALMLALNLLPSICSFKSHDLRLQGAVNRGLDRHAGTVVVIDIESQEILAAHNLEFAGKQLLRPGSTLKPFVVMELLDSDKPDPKQRLICRRPLRIAGLRLDCSHTSEVTQLDTDDAIAYLCNSYIAEASLRMNGIALAEALAGLDSLTGLANNESAGHIDRPATQEQLQLLALGARGIDVTPLELLAAYRKLAK